MSGQDGLATRPCALGQGSLLFHFPCLCVLEFGPQQQQEATKQCHLMLRSQRAPGLGACDALRHPGMTPCTSEKQALKCATPLTGSLVMIEVLTSGWELALLLEERGEAWQHVLVGRSWCGLALWWCGDSGSDPCFGFVSTCGAIVSILALVGLGLRRRWPPSEHAEHTDACSTTSLVRLV